MITNHWYFACQVRQVTTLTCLLFKKTIKITQSKIKHNQDYIKYNCSKDKHSLSTTICFVRRITGCWEHETIRQFSLVLYNKQFWICPGSSLDFQSKVRVLKQNRWSTGRKWSTHPCFLGYVALLLSHPSNVFQTKAFRPSTHTGAVLESVCASVLGSKKTGPFFSA